MAKILQFPTRSGFNGPKTKAVMKNTGETPLSPKEQLLNNLTDNISSQLEYHGYVINNDNIELIKETVNIMLGASFVGKTVCVEPHCSDHNFGEHNEK
jgi:hypothetical protein